MMMKHKVNIPILIVHRELDFSLQIAHQNIDTPMSGMWRGN